MQCASPAVFTVNPSFTGTAGIWKIQSNSEEKKRPETHQSAALKEDKRVKPSKQDKI